MKKYNFGFNHSLTYFIIYYVILSYYEILLRVFANDLHLHLMPFVFNLSYALLLTMITRAFKPSRILFFMILGGLGFIYGSQIYYYLFFSTYYIAYSFMQAGMVTGHFYREIIALIQNNLQVLFAIGLPIVILFYFRKKLKAAPWSWKKTVMIFMASIVLYGATALQITFRSKDDAVYDAYVYHPDVVDSVKTLGLISSFSVDIARLVRESIGMTNAVRIPENTDENPDNTGSSILYNKLAIPFDTLIANETDKTLKEMHEYFSKRNPTKQNAKTGLFKDYNLITITAETFSRWAVRQDLTPTLYKLVHEGYYFPSYYDPLWTVSTLDAEYVQFTSLIPKSGVWSLTESAKNDMSFVLGHQLKALGYTTFAFHDNDYMYYRRDVSHPNLGYTYMGVGNGLTKTADWPQSDLDMMKETIPMYINANKFHVYYMTVSGHSNYYWSVNSMATKNRALVNNLPYIDYVKGYLATQIELDRAIAYLLDQLQKAGKLDKTLIVLSADHYPYNMYTDTITNMNEGIPVEPIFDIYRSPLIMYNPKIVPETITKSVSSLDLLPTIANMMGIKFDSRLMMGTDIFSNTDPLVIFKDHSFITPAGRYNAKTKVFTYNPGIVDNPTYVDHMIQVVNAKFYFSQKFLELDYYKIIANSLKP